MDEKMKYMTPEEREYYQSLVSQFYELFKTDLANGSVTPDDIINFAYHTMTSDYGTFYHNPKILGVKKGDDGAIKQLLYAADDLENEAAKKNGPDAYAGGYASYFNSDTGEFIPQSVYRILNLSRDENNVLHSYNHIAPVLNKATYGRISGKIPSTDILTAYNPESSMLEGFDFNIGGLGKASDQTISNAYGGLQRNLYSRGGQMKTRVPKYLRDEYGRKLVRVPGWGDDDTDVYF